MKGLTKFFIGFSIIFMAYMAFSAGLVAEHHYWQNMITDLLLAVFWFGVLLANVFAYIKMKVDYDTDNNMREMSNEAEAIMNDIMQKFEVPGQVKMVTKKRKNGNI